MTLKILLKFGLDLKAQDEDGESILHLLAQEWNYIGDFAGILKLLLNHGLNINVQDNIGDSALHKVAYELFDTYLYRDEMMAMMILLINHGAEMMMKNQYGQNAFKLLITNGEFELAYVLLELSWDRPETKKWRKIPMDRIMDQLVEHPEVGLEVRNGIFNQWSENKKNALINIFTESEVFKPHHVLSLAVSYLL